MLQFIAWGLNVLGVLVKGVPLICRPCFGDQYVDVEVFEPCLEGRPTSGASFGFWSFIIRKCFPSIMWTSVFQFILLLLSCIYWFCPFFIYGYGPSIYIIKHHLWPNFFSKSIRIQWLKMYMLWYALVVHNWMSFMRTLRCQIKDKNSHTNNKHTINSYTLIILFVI